MPISASARLGFVRPEIPTLVPEPPFGEDWIHKIKHDGYRTLIIIEGGTVKAFSRHGRDWTGPYRRVVEAAGKLSCQAAILDCEIIVQDENGISDFDALRSAIHKVRHRIVFFAFDLLHLELKAKGVELRILAMQLDTATPTGKLMLNLMGSFAEFEREIMLERQREGVSKAKVAGKYKGRVPTARRQSAEVIKLRGQGLKPEQITSQLGISRASIFRVLKESANYSVTSAKDGRGDRRSHHHLCRAALRGRVE